MTAGVGGIGQDMNLRTLFDNLSLSELSANLQLFHAASAQRQMLGSINSSLVVYEAELINTANGECRSLSQQPELSREEQLALAAKKLLPVTDTPPSVLLLLPTSDFVATHFNLGVSGANLLKSALRLQVPTLLPACEDNLLLALSGDKPEGIALWYPQAAADTLFQAFAAENLHLAAIMPRSMAAASVDSAAAQNQFVLDEDEHYLSLLELEQSTLRVCLNMQRAELEDPAFNAQWQMELARMPAHTSAAKMNKSFWSGLRALLPAQAAYCFYPSGAVQAGKKLLARKQKTAGAVAMAALILLLALPFVSNWVQIAYLNRQVDEYRDLSTAARQSQTAVYDIEDAWGAVAEFPRQDVGQVLLNLNEFIENSLSSFSINKGVIDITGLSQDPALLIEQLAELELFYDVGQSRSSSGGNNASLGDRFGIRMNLSGVDFPDYEKKFAATAQ